MDQDRLRRAMELHMAGNLGPAWELYHSLLAAEPGNPEITHLMGVLAGQAGNLLESVKLIGQAIAARPNVPEFHKNLAITWQRLEDNTRAAAEFMIAGDLLSDEKRFDEAVDHYVQGARADPANDKLLNNLGATLNSMGRHAEAKAWLEQALAPDPTLPPDLAVWPGQQGSDRFERQIPSLHLNYGNALMGLEDYRRAMAYFNNVVTLKPDSVEAHGNLALTHLLLGELADGWREFEWRWQSKAYLRTDLDGKRWEGQSARDLGGPLLVLSEQGYGDTIQFARYLPMLVEAGYEVLLETKPELMTLFSECTGLSGVTLVPARDAAPGVYADLGYAAHTGLISLPGLLGTDTVGDIPGHTPYLDVAAKRAEAWKKRLAKDTRRLKVGIVWGGNPNHPRNAQRSIPAPLLHPLLDRPDITFYSLQKGPAAKWPFPFDNVVVLDQQIADFADTAAAMLNLDLVIGADTGATHLAAALNVPCWVMVTKVPDWRWLLEREDSPWYPSVRLFRQNEAGNWPEVLERVAKALDGYKR